MSRATPRKSRHRQHPSGGPRAVAAASDYESDVAHYLEARDLRPAARSNTELNLSVLRRYLPNIRSIVSIAANSVVYVFTAATQNWEKSGVEGTLFVCEQEPLVVGRHVLPRACVFILNRKGLNNVIVDLAKATNCEATADLLIFRMEDDVTGDGSEEDEGNTMALGLWIHADEDHTRTVNATVIQEFWRQVRGTVTSATVNATGQGAPIGQGDSTRPRQPTISDLFGQAMGTDTGNGT